MGSFASDKKYELAIAVGAVLIPVFEALSNAVQTGQLTIAGTPWQVTTLAALGIAGRAFASHKQEVDKLRDVVAVDSSIPLEDAIAVVRSKIEDAEQVRTALLDLLAPRPTYTATTTSGATTVTVTPTGGE
jgi:hypothetical protein